MTSPFFLDVGFSQWMIYVRCCETSWRSCLQGSKCHTKTFYMWHFYPCRWNHHTTSEPQAAISRYRRATSRANLLWCTIHSAVTRTRHYYDVRKWGWGRNPNLASDKVAVHSMFMNKGLKVAVVGGGNWRMLVTCFSCAGRRGNFDLKVRYKPHTMQRQLNKILA